MAWVNAQLKKRPAVKPVQDLRQDLRDGVILAYLIEIVGRLALDSDASLKQNMAFLPSMCPSEQIVGGGLVTKSCPTLVTPMDCSPPGSSVHEISQARILEWVAIQLH